MSDSQDPSTDHEVIEVEEFESYFPILGCAVVPACGIALLISWWLRSVEASAWADWALGVAYATLPCAAFARWTWNKKAIRLRNGRVLATVAARRLALAMWAAAVAVLVWRMLTW